MSSSHRPVRPIVGTCAGGSRLAATCFASRRPVPQPVPVLRPGPPPPQSRLPGWHAPRRLRAAQHPCIPCCSKSKLHSERELSARRNSARRPV
jgi:hypothetical protein